MCIEKKTTTTKNSTINECMNVCCPFIFIFSLTYLWAWKCLPWSGIVKNQKKKIMKWKSWPNKLPRD